jgi:hypothetical protein
MPAPDPSPETPNAPPAAPAADGLGGPWYVRVAGQAYGPYDAAQMVQYAREGRVTARTEVFSPPLGAWVRAGGVAALNAVLAARAGGAAPGAIPSATPAAGPEATTPAVSEPAADDRRNGGDGRTGEGRHAGEGLGRREAESMANFVIVADIRTRTVGDFELALSEFGHFTQVASTVWVFSGAISLNHLRNALVPHLGTTDTLFIADATNDRVNWHNLGPNADSRLRQVWQR